MKLQRICPELPPVRIRLTVPGDLKVVLEAYAAYYRKQYGDTVSLEELVPEILLTFVNTDREFRLWQQAQTEDDTVQQSSLVAAPAPTKSARPAARTAHNASATPNGVAPPEAES